MDERITETIYRLIDFAQAKGLTYPIDRWYMINSLLDIMGLDAPAKTEYEKEAIPETATKYLDILADCACQKGLIKDTGERRDLFTTKIMGALTPSPASVREKFVQLSRISKKAATDWFYSMSRVSDYIKVDRVAKNERFFENSPCGRFEITINLSKPEKDPRDIAAARKKQSAEYPKCMLCIQNPGYAGRMGFPARQNLRMMPITLDNAQWYLQYSPYLYYNEHCIVLNEMHLPMKICHDTFIRLFDFVEQLPHYFLGSNADLPIVGGSILTHDHFQGGCHRFPMDDAGVKIQLNSPIDGVEACVADWPMTCIRLFGKDRMSLTEAADRILDAWRGYTDEERFVFAETDGEKHNTITPILRMEDGRWKLDLVLRNNITTKEHPLGLYHPHSELHHIKKENIGLIEVMGLFILPGRLVNEFEEAGKYLTGEIAIDKAPDPKNIGAKHYGWVKEIAKKTGVNLTHDEAQRAMRKELSAVCYQVLKDAGVFKDDEGVLKFLNTVGFTKK